MNNIKYGSWEFKVKKLFDENYPNENYYRILDGNADSGWLCEELDTKEIIIIVKREDFAKLRKKENLIPKYKKGDKVYYSYLHNGIVSGKVDKICATYTYCIDNGKSWHLVTEQELYATEAEAQKAIKGE